jgi:hypothetical protein
MAGSCEHGIFVFHKMQEIPEQAEELRVLASREGLCSIQLESKEAHVRLIM